MSNEILKHNEFMNDLKRNNPELSLNDMLYYSDIALHLYKNEPGTSDSVYYGKESYKYYRGDVHESIKNIRVVHGYIYFDATFKLYNERNKYKAIFMLVPSFGYDFKYIDDDNNSYRVYELYDVEYQFDCEDDILKTSETYY